MALGAAAYQPFFFGAVARSGVALSTLVTVGVGPVYAGLLGWAFLRHRPTRAWLLATLVAVVGLVLRSWGELRLGDGVGLLMALVAGLGAASYVVAAKHELDRGGHAVELPGAAYLLGSLLLVPFVLRESLAWVVTPSGLGVALYLGVVTMALANVFAVQGIRGMSPGPASTLLLADPLTATVLGVAVLGETLTSPAVVGLVLVLVGLVLQARALRPEDASTDEPVPAL
jgi:DME family drug/metabolite transporter